MHDCAHPIPSSETFFAAWNSALQHLLGTLTNMHGNMAPEIYIRKEIPLHEIESI